MVSRRSAADIAVLFAALLWGTSFYFQKEAMSHVGPLLFTGLRGAIAAVVLLPMALRERRQTTIPSHSVLGYGIAGGLVFLAAGALQQTGLLTATMTNTAFLTALYVVVTPFLLWLLRGENLGPRIWFSAGLAFIGVWLLGGGNIGAFSMGDMLVAASSVFWSILMVVASASGKVAKPVQFTFIQFVTLAALALPLAFWFEPVTLAAIKAAAPSLLFVGVVASAVTYAIMASAVRVIPASRASILLSTEVLFAALVGYLILDERLGLINWVGAACLLVAIVAVQTAKPSTPQAKPVSS